jgi:hypothetical protein
VTKANMPFFNIGLPPILVQSNKLLRGEKLARLLRVFWVFPDYNLKDYSRGNLEVYDRLLTAAPLDFR